MNALEETLNRIKSENIVPPMTTHCRHWIQCRREINGKITRGPMINGSRMDAILICYRARLLTRLNHWAIMA